MSITCSGALLSTGDVVLFEVNGVRCARRFEHGLRQYPMTTIDGVDCVAVVLNPSHVAAFDERTKATESVGTLVKAKGVMGKCGVRFVEWQPPAKDTATAALALLRQLHQDNLVMKHFSIEHLTADGKVVLAQQNVSGKGYEPPTARPLPIEGTDRAAAALVAVASQALARQYNVPLWPFRAKASFEQILRGRKATDKAGLKYNANYYWMLEKLQHDTEPEYSFTDQDAFVDALFRDAEASEGTFRDLLRLYDDARNSGDAPGPRTTLMRVVQAHKADKPFLALLAKPRRRRQ